MTCHDFWRRMPEPDPDPEELNHLRECVSCAALVDRRQILQAGLQSLAARHRPLQAPARVEQELVASFRRQAAPQAALRGPSRWNRASMRAWLPAAAAVAILGVWLGWDLRPRNNSHELSPSAQLSAVQSGEGGGWDSDFIPLPYARGELASEQGDLVRVQVPRSTLVAWGVPLTEETGDAVEAEVLLGTGGAPQAVRLLQ